MKRSQLQNLVKHELENWDEPLMDDFESRAASARPAFGSSTAIDKKQPWFNQN